MPDFHVNAENVNMIITARDADAAQEWFMDFVCRREVGVVVEAAMSGWSVTEVGE